MQVIPLQPVPSQSANVTLAGQICEIVVATRGANLFLDLYKDGALVIGGVVCENLNRIVRSLYLGFAGDLIFIDDQGTDDPQYTGLGSRWNLAYVEASELPPGEG